jgi:hypothetical protein
MKNLKAIFGGLITIIILGLVMQLVFLLLSVAYIKLVKSYPSITFLSDISVILLFIATAVVAFIGGVVTAKLSQSKLLINSLITGILASTLTLIPSLVSGYSITVNAAIFVLVFLISTVSGGAYYSRINR